MPTAATMLALCASLFPPLGLPALPTMITLSSRSQSTSAVTELFHNAHAYFTVSIRMRSHSFFHNAQAFFTVTWLWPAFIHARSRTPASLKLKVPVAMDVLGFARGLTRSDALNCCQDHVVVLMVDETDLERGLIRS